jgi:hypothetical protein
MVKQKKNGNAVPKKKGQKEKLAKKARREERRAQQEQQLLQRSGSIDINSDDEIDRFAWVEDVEENLLVGRLYLFLPVQGACSRDDFNSYRGILKRIEGEDDEKRNDNGEAVFLPVAAALTLKDEDHGSEEELYVKVPLKNVVRRQISWTLRF